MLTCTWPDLIDLSLTKSVNPTTYSVGSTVTFTITVSNASGFSNASGVSVKDLVPSGYTYVSDNGTGSYVPATGIWTVGALAAGSSKSLQITATVDASGEYSNYAQVQTANESDEDSMRMSRMKTQRRAMTQRPRMMTRLLVEHRVRRLISV